jgi:hypothetical protein
MIRDPCLRRRWIPAFAGMTFMWGRPPVCHRGLDPCPQHVIPDLIRDPCLRRRWIPAFAGMTFMWGRPPFFHPGLDPCPQHVIPDMIRDPCLRWLWIPAFAGMTFRWSHPPLCHPGLDPGSMSSWARASALARVQTKGSCSTTSLRGLATQGSTQPSAFSSAVRPGHSIS